jgi:hypothetical protein
MQDESRARERNEHDEFDRSLSNRVLPKVPIAAPASWKVINFCGCDRACLYFAIIARPDAMRFGRRGVTSEWRQTWFMSAACYQAGQ